MLNSDESLLEYESSLSAGEGEYDDEESEEDEEADDEGDYENSD
jgi:hypothetical protein